MLRLKFKFSTFYETVIVAGDFLATGDTFKI